MDMLEEIGLLEAQPTEIPLETSLKLEPYQGDLLQDPTRYGRLIGKLIYVTITRPDLSFAVSLVSQLMQEPRMTHWKALIRILRYLKKFPARGMLYKRKDDDNSQMIQGFVDSDWAGFVHDRRSTSGYCISLGGNMVIWKSKK